MILKKIKSENKMERNTFVCLLCWYIYLYISQSFSLVYFISLGYDDSESPILHNSNLFHAIQNSFQTIPNFFHATRNSFRATPNMFPLIVHLVCNICKNNFHHPIWSWNLRILLHVPAKLNKKQINSMNVCSGRKWL